jgi:Ca2+-binding EF-hand superfamily protein
MDLSFHEILNFFDHLDTNKDGAIDEKEFITGLYPNGFMPTNQFTNILDSSSKRGGTMLFSDELVSVLSRGA